MDFHFFIGIIISIIFPTWSFDIGQKASGCLLQLVRFPFLWRRFLEIIRDGHESRWIIRFGVFRVLLVNGTWFEETKVPLAPGPGKD